jgi:predicted nucleic acid-binding protein
VDAYFFDSSALVKRYTNEVGSKWILRVTDVSVGNTLYVASITEVEVVSAITRKLREAVIAASDAASRISELRYDFAKQYSVSDVNELVIEKAISVLQSHALRGYDAIQLAAAMQVNETRISLQLPAVIFVSADVNLNNAARAEGLVVEDPNLHP